ncbi:MAG: DUF2179 domain-containing protein [Bacilli bacterium]|nr:DUF2179 domain-containing protein [Bacilli bacterium]
MIYVIIFILKIIENMISTLRIIFVSNQNKIIGSILLFLSSVIWILSSSITIINIDLISILVFSIGSFIGAYLGVFLEEKIALGTFLIICITSSNIEDKLRNMGYIITSLSGNGKDGIKNILFIVINRKNVKELFNSINKLDNKAIIINEYTNIYKK